ncbi:MAG: hypothetical protein ABSH53_05775 [Holophaga sp.]
MKRIACTGPILAALILAALQACGGGGGGSSSPPATNPGAMEGPWTGSITSNTSGQKTGAALVLSTGAMAMGADDGISAAGSISASGTSFSGSGTAVSPSALTGQHFTVNGNVTADQSFSGTYATPTDSGTVSFNWDANADYTTPVNMANMAGTWQSTSNFANATLNGTLATDGAFTGTSPSGTFNTQLSVVDPAKNAFTIQGSYTQSNVTAPSAAWPSSTSSARRSCISRLPARPTGSGACSPGNSSRPRLRTCPPSPASAPAQPPSDPGPPPPSPGCSPAAPG